MKPKNAPSDCPELLIVFPVFWLRVLFFSFFCLPLFSPAAYPLSAAISLSFSFQLLLSYRLVPQRQPILDTLLQSKRLTKVLFALCYTSALLALKLRLFGQGLVMVLVAEMEALGHHVA